MKQPALQFVPLYSIIIMINFSLTKLPRKLIPILYVYLYFSAKIYENSHSFLTVESPECVVPLNSRLKAFVHVFIGLPVS